LSVLAPSALRARRAHTHQSALALAGAVGGSGLSVLAPSALRARRAHTHQIPLALAGAVGVLVLPAGGRRGI
jgi:hypothetical protein